MQPMCVKDWGSSSTASSSELLYSLVAGRVGVAVVYKLYMVRITRIICVQLSLGGPPCKEGEPFRVVAVAV